MNVASSTKHIETATNKMRTFREQIDTFNATWFSDATETAASVGVEVSVPRVSGRQRHRSNVPASTPAEFYSRTVAIPLLGE